MLSLCRRLEEIYVFCFLVLCFLYFIILPCFWKRFTSYHSGNLSTHCFKILSGSFVVHRFSAAEATYFLWEDIILWLLWPLSRPLTATSEPKNSQISFTRFHKCNIVPYLLYHYLSVYSFSTCLFEHCRYDFLQENFRQRQKYVLTLTVFVLKGFSTCPINNSKKITKENYTISS